VRHTACKDNLHSSRVRLCHGGLPPIFGGSGGTSGTGVSESIDFGQGAIPLGGTTYPGTPPFLPSGGSGGSGGSGDFGNIGGMLGNLKNIKGSLGGFTRNSAGKVTSVGGMAGTALFAGGSMLAQQGLLGSSRGTTLGMFEGVAGDAFSDSLVGQTILIDNVPVLIDAVSTDNTTLTTHTAGW
jgi:hypothetical protein